MTNDQKKYLNILLYKWSRNIINSSIENMKIDIDVIKNNRITEEYKKQISFLKPTSHMLLIKQEIEKLLPLVANINPVYKNSKIQPEDFNELFVQHNLICINKIKKMYSENIDGKTENSCDV